MSSSFFLMTAAALHVVEENFNKDLKAHEERLLAGWLLLIMRRLTDTKRACVAFEEGLDFDVGEAPWMCGVLTPYLRETTNLQAYFSSTDRRYVISMTTRSK